MKLQNDIKNQKIIKEYCVKNLGGFSKLRFLESGDIVLIDESFILNSNKETYMSVYENLYDFLSRNMNKYCRDELLFLIKKEIKINPNEIFIPFNPKSL